MDVTTDQPFQVVLVSTYELGRQPFGVASAAAWLRSAGFAVSCFDLACEPPEEAGLRAADFVGFYIPMHTATRLAVEVLPRVQSVNPKAHLCFFGLYAPMNEAYLRGLGAGTILGGEFESGLLNAVNRLARQRDGAGRSSWPQPEAVIALGRQQFLLPYRDGLPALAQYARLEMPDGSVRRVGYTEASRGCKHRCRHCPVVPVYGGQFRIVQRDVVLADVRQQVAAGAEHITFGDPDFFNGIRHALEIVRALHREFPQVTYDVTIKIEHLLRYSSHLPTLRDTGCLFVTTAVESVDDAVLARLDKGHTSADFVRVAGFLRDCGLALSPTFVPFTPWTTVDGYCALLRTIAELDLVEHVAPVQLAIRLLVPAGSRLLELPDLAQYISPFDHAGLVYPWRHSHPIVDQLQERVESCVQRSIKRGEPRSLTFRRVWSLAYSFAGRPAAEVPQEQIGAARATVPYLTEPWYC
jgi:radical SAM superfamily enzyme YgiQ (UPF0313 family)